MLKLRASGVWGEVLASYNEKLPIFFHFILQREGVRATRPIHEKDLVLSVPLNLVM